MHALWRRFLSAASNLSQRFVYKKPGPFLSGRWEWAKFFSIVIILMASAPWLGRNFLFEPMGEWYRDFQLRRREKVQEKVTRLIKIDEESFEKLFSGRSPLPGLALVQAACAIASHGAAVVLVDVSTAKSDLPEDFRLPVSPAPIIWAVDTDWVEKDGELIQSADEVLGGHLKVQPLYGIAKMPTGFDGVVRDWTRFEKVDGYLRRTVVEAAVQEYCGLPGKGCAAEITGGGDERTTRFDTDVDFADVGISDLLDEVTTAIPDSCPVSRPDPRVKGRIAVLGGGYSRDDRHQTPWGTRDGARLVAMAIEQAFANGRSNQTPEAALLAFELFVAFLIAAIHHWIRPICATLITLVLMPIGVIVSAEITFALGGRDVAIVPFMFGLLIHQLVGSVLRAEERERDRRLPERAPT